MPVIIHSYKGGCKQPNLASLQALLLVCEDSPVLVHGTTAFSNRVTTAMLLEALNLPICSNTPEVIIITQFARKNTA